MFTREKHGVIEVLRFAREIKLNSVKIVCIGHDVELHCIYQLLFISIFHFNRDCSFVFLLIQITFRIGTYFQNAKWDLTVLTWVPTWFPHIVCRSSASMSFLPMTRSHRWTSAHIHQSNLQWCPFVLWLLVSSACTAYPCHSFLNLSSLIMILFISITF